MTRDEITELVNEARKWEECPFLSRVDLRGIDLSDVDLQGVCFSFVDLRDAKLTNADLRNTIWIDSRLGGADLRGADIRGAILRGVFDADISDCRNDKHVFWFERRENTE